MIIVAMLLALSGSVETGSLGTLSLGGRQVCGVRRTGPSGPELVDARGAVVVDARIMEEAERMAPAHVMDGARYCVSLENGSKGPRAASITHATPFGAIGG